MKLQTSDQPDLASHTSDRSRAAPSMECAAAFLLTLGLLLWIQFASPAIIGNDAYYHIRWSRMLRSSLPHLHVFTWLPLTVLRASDFVDQHFLFHVLLMPFTFGDLRLGAKLAAPLFSALAITSIFALLVTCRIRYRWLWLLALVVGSEPFLYRMSMTRDPGPALILLAVGVYLILERKYIPLAVLTFAFVWLYNMFPLILVFAAAYAITIWLSERRLALGALYATSIGAALGLVVNPYFPKDFLLIFHHVHMLLAETVAIDVGGEWYPFETWEMLTGNAVLFALCFAALLAFDFRKHASGLYSHPSENRSGLYSPSSQNTGPGCTRSPAENEAVLYLEPSLQRPDSRPLFFLILATVFLLMAMRWRRFFEYWPPFAVLFAAFTFDSVARVFPACAPAHAGGPEASVERVDHPSTSTRPRRLPARLAIAACLIVVGAFGIVNIRGARAEIRDTDNPIAMRAASAWLADHTPAGSMIFNADWAEFPELFYYNQRNVYVTGLDPRYLYDSQPDLWKVYDSITEGQEKHPGPIIRARFGAEYIIARADSTDFLNAANTSNDFDTVYSDTYASILHVR